MFYRFFVLADSGPCSQFYDPIYKSEIFKTDSLAVVYLKFGIFLQDFMLEEFPLQDLTPDVVYVVYGEDPEVCPYRSTNKRQPLFGFGKGGKPFRALGCEHL